MDVLVLLQSLIMGVVEGLTEFLPISSTGHLILTGQLLGFLDKDKRDVYEIFIQLGAMLAVCWEFRQKITSVAKGLVKTDPAAQQFVMNLIVAFMPAAVFGLLFGKQIKQHLFSPVPVALAFIVGGLIILWAERRAKLATTPIHIENIDQIDTLDALKIGFLQCLAVLFPGMSRSGSTIIGGMFIGFSRKAATEFSFFLGIPTLGLASLYSLYKHRSLLSAQDALIFAVGFMASFVVALLVIRVLLRYIVKHDFTIFAWYRIAFGLIVLATAYSGLVQWTA